MNLIIITYKFPVAKRIFSLIFPLSYPNFLIFLRDIINPSPFIAASMMASRSKGSLEGSRLVIEVVFIDLELVELIAMGIPIRDQEFELLIGYSRRSTRAIFSETTVASSRILLALF